MKKGSRVTTSVYILILTHFTVSKSLLSKQFVYQENVMNESDELLFSVSQSQDMIAFTSDFFAETRTCQNQQTMFLKSFGCVFLLITNTKISYSQNDDKTLLEKVEDLFDDGEELMKKSVITLNEKSLLHYFELCNKFKSFSPFCFHVMQQKRRFWKLCLILTMFKFLFQ